MRTIVSVLCNGTLDTRFNLNREQSYTHNLASHLDFAMLLSRNLATIPQLSDSRLQVIPDSNFDSVFYIVIEDQSTMNTCSTANPNYLLVDSSLDRTSVESFYWDCVMNGTSDDSIYDCDIEDCNHEFCILTDVFNINRVDRLLFPELESVSKVYIWNSEYTGIGHWLVDDPNPMPVYALGL